VKGLANVLSALGAEIGAWVALGVAQTGTEGATWQAKLATGAAYLAGAGTAIWAGKELGQKFANASDFATGGWIGRNPNGGKITVGTPGVDNVFLKSSHSGSVNNYGMKDEYVVNRRSTAKYFDLIEAINQDRVFAEGGPVTDPMPPTRRINDAGFDTFWTTAIQERNWVSAIAAAIAYYAGTGAGMIAGKALGPEVMGYSAGGAIGIDGNRMVYNRKHGFGSFLGDIFGNINDTIDDIIDPLDINEYLDPAGFDPLMFPSGDPIRMFDPLGYWLDRFGIPEKYRKYMPYDAFKDGNLGFDEIWKIARQLPIIKEAVIDADNILYPFVRDGITPGANINFSTVKDSLQEVFDIILKEIASISLLGTTGGSMFFSGGGPLGFSSGNAGEVLGSYASGTSYPVSRTGSYVLHKGEEVRRAADVSRGAREVVVPVTVNVGNEALTKFVVRVVDEEVTIQAQQGVLDKRVRA
jgi:hypothetical protein